VHFLSNILGTEGCAQLAQSLRTMTSLVNLHVGSNAINTAGINLLKPALKFHTILRSLSIQNNHLGDVGMVVLGEALEFHTSLTCLNVGYNGCTDVISYSKLLDVALVNTRLRILKLPDITADTVVDSQWLKRLLVDIVRNNTMMFSLDVGDPFARASVKEELAKWYSGIDRHTLNQLTGDLTFTTFFYPLNCVVVRARRGFRPRTT